MKDILLYFKASAYEDLSIAYAKLQNREKMFNAMETVIQIYEEIENVLKDRRSKRTNYQRNKEILCQCKRVAYRNCGR